MPIKSRYRFYINLLDHKSQMLILHNTNINKDKNFAFLHLYRARRQHKHLPEELVRAEYPLFSIKLSIWRAHLSESYR